MRKVISYCTIVHRKARILIKLFSLVLSFSLLISFSFSGVAKASSPDQCVDCHQNQVNDWKKSDHAKAMDIANPSSVLADFNNASVEHYGQSAKFTNEDGKYWATISRGETTQKYQLDYTFGHYPLQQFLVKADGGRYQVLPFSWDSRPESEGGQRWFAIYADEDIKPNDRLHWQQPLQNWNGMCADCHSDGLKRNYSVAENTFSTSWDNINVGCQSCHGKMTDHAKTGKFNTEDYAGSKEIAKWLLSLEDLDGEWITRKPSPKRDNRFMENCYACHSLRSPLTDGFVHDAPFLDQFSPNFIAAPLYHADGQIKEEVYVYGSFLQSKMHAAGVNCLDCHNEHSMKLKAPDNGVCSQCHNPQVFDVVEHHGHKEQSTGSLCVSCHMPTTTYMGVDARRDHSFKIPRPHLSDKFDTPNACVACHDDKSNQWATDSLKKWHGAPAKLSSTKMDFQRLQIGERLSIAQHLAIINDSSLSEILRATAITQLPNTVGQLFDAQIQGWVDSELPLIRLALAKNGQLLAPEDRQKSFSKLLKDEYRSVRTAAANHLINIPIADKTLLQKSLNELMHSNDISSWRGEGHLNQSMVHMNIGDAEKTIESLTRGIKVDPYFTENYINLADIYRAMGDANNEKKTFEAGLEATPNAAMLQYSYGLHLIRSKQIGDALNAFAKAVKISPDNSQFAYVYLIAMDANGQTKRALSILKSIIRRFNGDPQLAQLGMSYAQKMNDEQSYNYFAKFLQK